MDKEQDAGIEPGAIILDHGANPPTFWVVKSKRTLVAVLDDGSVLTASFKGKLWKGASTINNRSLAMDIKLRFSHGVTIGSEWVDTSALWRMKVKDLRRDGQAILEVLQCPKPPPADGGFEGVAVGEELTMPIKKLQEDYQRVPD